MAKLTLNDITGGYQTADAYNANNALMEAALENTLSLDGTTPNQMQANLDMNSNDLQNVGTVNTAALILNDTVITTTTTLTGGLDALEVAFTPAGGSLTTLQDALDDDYLRNDRNETITGTLGVSGVVTAAGLVGPVTGDVAGDLTGTVITAAQPNITSLGIIEDLVVTGAVVADGVTQPKTKIIEIGDWDMDATTLKFVIHGLDYTLIRSVEVWIRLDAPSAVYPLKWNTDGDYYFDNTYVYLSRVVAGVFDSTNADATSYNRGWVVITYLDA